MNITERLTDLRTRVDGAWQVLDLDAIQKQIAALDIASTAPDFWSDQDRARRDMQELADLRKEYDAWASLRTAVMEAQEWVTLSEKENDQEALVELQKNIEELEGQYQSLEFSMLLAGPHDAKAAVMGIHAGAGGTDAQDWAEMLLRMYLRYAEEKGWKATILDESHGTEAGIKSVLVTIEGRYAYGHLKSEAGVHRLVRMSPFNADGLRQTSFTLVEVLPDVGDDVEVDIKPEDLRIDTFMSGGKGGQSVNTTYSAVRIVHIPTKITVSCQNERSQAQNKAAAMKVLKAKLLALKEEQAAKEKKELRGEYHSAEWGNQIRSYVLAPYRLVKDHRTNVETSDTDAVLNGDINAFIEGYLRREAAARDTRGEMNRDT